MSIQFYRLRDSTDLKEIGGDFPQVQRTYDGYDKKAQDSYLKVKGNAFPDFEPNLYYFTINPKGNLTDMISTSMLANNGSLISERFKNLLEDDFNLAPHRFFPATLKYKGEFRNDYYWMHVVSDNSQYIDFEHTKFIVSSPGGLFIKNPEPKSQTELIEVIKENIKDSNLTNTKEVYLKGSFYNQNLDLFGMSGIFLGLFISEKLRERIILEKITGVDMPVAAIAPL
jgi:hypothetical protein